MVVVWHTEAEVVVPHRTMPPALLAIQVEGAVDVGVEVCEGVRDSWLLTKQHLVRVVL